MDEEAHIDEATAIVSDALEEVQTGILSELDLLTQQGPTGGRKFLRCRPNFEIGQGDLYGMQVGHFPGAAGRLKGALEGLLGRPKEDLPGLPGSNWNF